MKRYSSNVALCYACALSGDTWWRWRNALHVFIEILYRRKLKRKTIHGGRKHHSISR